MWRSWRGGNAITNNFLKHTEAQILQNLKDKALAGKCDSNCQTELKALADLDNKRNADLEACSGVIDPKSNNLNIDIQAAYLTDSFRKNCRTFAGDFCRCRRWPMAACLS